MRRVALLVALVALWVSLVAPSALASAPTITRESVDVTEVSAECGFPVEAHYVGDRVSIMWTDEDGTRIHEAYPRLKVTLTDPSTKESLVINISGPYRSMQSPDGGYTEIGTGNYLWGAHPVTLEPGLFLSKGRWVRSRDAAGNETFSIVGNVVALCPLLAA